MPTGKLLRMRRRAPHGGARKFAEELPTRPGTPFALRTGMNPLKATHQARTLHLVTTTDERPTDPASLKPIEGTEHSVTVPRLAPLPAGLLTEVSKLPPPNPDSYTEMSIALLLRNIESNNTVESLLERAIDRINMDADARRERATTEITKNFELTNHEVQKLANTVGQLESTVRALIPRLGKIENRLESGDDRFARIELDMAAMRSQMDRLDRELAVLRGIQDAAGATEKKT